MNAFPFVPPSAGYRSSLGVQTQIDTLYSAVSSATQTANAASNEAETVGNELVETNEQVATNTGDIVNIKAGMGIMAEQIVTLSGKTVNMSVSGNTTIFDHTIRCQALEINSETQSQAYTAEDHTAVGTISGLTTKVTDLETITASMSIGYDQADLHETVDFSSDAIRCKALSFLEGDGTVGHQKYPYTYEDRVAVQSISGPSGLTTRVTNLETKTAPMTIGYDDVNLLTASVFSNGTVRCNTLTVVGAGNTGVQRHPYTDADRSLLQTVSFRTAYMSTEFHQTVFSGRLVADTVFCQSIQLHNATEPLRFPDGTVQTSAYIPSSSPIPMLKFEAYSTWDAAGYLNPYPDFGPKLIGLPGYPLGRNVRYGPAVRITDIGEIVEIFDPASALFDSQGFFKIAGKFEVNWSVNFSNPKWLQYLQGELIVRNIYGENLYQTLRQGRKFTYQKDWEADFTITCLLYCEIPTADTWQLCLQLSYDMATADEDISSINASKLNASVVVRQVG